MAEVDPLGEALHAVRMSGAFYCRSELTAPWALGMPQVDGCLSFHVVVDGSCRLEVGDEVVALRPGDLALVPHGQGHRLASAPNLVAPPLSALSHQHVSERYAILRHGGGGEACALVCGAVRFEHPAARQLVTMLPQVIHVPASRSPQTEWIRGTLQLMAVEAEALDVGGEAVITRLADILVIHAIRAWMRRDPSAQRGWLGALSDPQIGKALALIHREPERDWTLASLASAAAMSRSAFAARFADKVGEPAMQYLTRWRMHVAVGLLEDGEPSLAELASKLGYGSEAAFSRAFKRHVGKAPGAVRRHELRAS